MQLIARLHLPAQYDTSNSVAVPLLLDFHGWTGTAHDQESASWTRDKIIVVSHSTFYLSSDRLILVITVAARFQRW